MNHQVDATAFATNAQCFTLPPWSRSVPNACRTQSAIQGQVPLVGPKSKIGLSHFALPTSHFVRRSFVALVALVVAATPATAQITLTGVTPDSAWGVESNLGAFGDVTFMLTGSFAFPGPMTVTLRRPGLTDVVTTNVNWVDPVTVAATLSMIGVAGGKWDMELVHGVLGSATLPAALTVKPAPHLRRVSTWGGPVQAMKVRQEMIGGQPRQIGYVARGSGMVVLDVTDPDNLVELGGLDLAGDVWNLDVAGDYAFVAVHGYGVYLAVVDVSDPSNPRLVVDGLEAGITPFTDVLLHNNTAYLLQGASDGSSGSLVMLDINDPSSLVAPGAFIGGGQLVWAIAVEGDHLYTVHKVQGTQDMELQVFDISADPMAPVLTGSTILFVQLDNPRDLAVVDGVAYIVGKEFTGSDAPGKLVMVDVSDPTSPTVNGLFLDDLQSPLGIRVQGGVAYITDTSAGLDILDVSTPALPVRLGTFAREDRNANHVTLDGTTAFLLDYAEGVIAIDVSDPANPTRLSTWRSPAWLAYMAKRGDVLYASDLWGGVSALDVSDARSPTLLGFYETPQQGGPHNGGVATRDDYVYLAAGFGGLHTVDFSDPASPLLVAVHPVSNPEADIANRGMALREDLLVVGGDWKDRIFDVSNPATPVLLGLLNNEFQNPLSDNEEFAISPNMFVYKAGDYGFCRGEINDLMDPLFPFTGCFSAPENITVDVAVEGNRLYAIKKIFGNSTQRLFEIFDLLPDGSAISVGSQLMGRANSVVVQDRLAYVSAPPLPVEFNGLLTVFDIQNLSASGTPRVIAGGNGPGYQLLTDAPYLFGVDEKNSFDDRLGSGLVIYQTAALGDADNDFDTDLADYAALQRCFGTDGVEPPEAICLVFDFDEDDDVDGDDTAPFTGQMVGPN